MIGRNTAARANRKNLDISRLLHVSISAFLHPESPFHFWFRLLPLWDGQLAGAHKLLLYLNHTFKGKKTKASRVTRLVPGHTATKGPSQDGNNSSLLD